MIDRKKMSFDYFSVSVNHKQAKTKRQFKIYHTVNRLRSILSSCHHVIIIFNIIATDARINKQHQDLQICFADNRQIYFCGWEFETCTMELITQCQERVYCDQSWPHPARPRT